MKKAKKRNNFFIKNMKESLSYIAESKSYIYFVILLFVLFILVGGLFEAPEFLAKQIMKMFKDILDSMAGLSVSETILAIFRNNLAVSAMGIFFGILFGVVPLAYTIVNGYVLGFVLRLAVREGGVISLWRLFPHGIFELPAVIVSLGLGIKFGMSFFTHNPDKEFIRRLGMSFKTFVSIIIPLLIIAAVIEGILVMFAS